MLRLLLLFNLWFIVNLSNGFDLRDSYTSGKNLIGEVCQSKNIRSSAQELNKLRNCSVIEGYLMITLMYHGRSGTSLENLEFPLLTEVTEFVLFYRVDGLKSLGKLFPNLRVIRGNFLVEGYSFIVFEMLHLQEIGLKSLIEISHGGVRIERNPLLCFVDTIEWSLITSNNNVFRNNRATKDCPTCPDVGRSFYDNNGNSLECPESNGKSLCWNSSQCQQVCPSDNGNSTCNANGDPCDELCFGCDEVGKCLSCRYVNIGNSRDPQCVKECPANMFSYGNSRCITDSECRALKRHNFMYDLLEYPYISHDGECSYNCPNNFYPDGPSGHRRCIVISKKECPPIQIESVLTARQYSGCTHITGPLVIRIIGQSEPNIDRELENSLSNIEVIEGNLVVDRSDSLSSLGFFKKLRLVRNHPIGEERYGIKVTENENLQTLFPQNVTIEHGRMFFHFNPKLCMNFIDELKHNVVDLQSESNFEDNEVTPLSNGDRVACNIIELNVEIMEIRHNTVAMQLETPLDNDGQVIGYLVYYKPARFQNVTMFDGSAECGEDGWLLNDVPDNNRNSTLTTVIAQLKPDTQYAYYVQTYTSGKQVGLTKVKYFRTTVTSNLTLPASSNSEINVPCTETGRKECPPGYIVGILTAQRYRGCTHITGQLVINIKNPAGRIVLELENSLSNIEVIEGNLIVQQSYPLFSLGFLRNLRLVKNHPIGREKYGIKVIGNQNLRALFPQNVTIEHGRMLFHFNSKLCMNIIDEFKRNVVDLQNEWNFTYEEVAPTTNGDKTACHISELKVKIKKIKHDMVVMKLQPLLHDDYRTLLGYSVYYIPASHRNVTMFDGRDACGCDGWQVKEIVGENLHAIAILFTLPQLKPFTQYAYFIRTRTTDSQQNGGSTSVEYFRTAAYKPGPVRSLSISANGSSEINVRWDPPVHPNGILTKYIITIIMIPDDTDLLNNRNYCDVPLSPIAKEQTAVPSHVNPLQENDGTDTCEVKQNRERSYSISSKVAEDAITFENALQNMVFIKRKIRRRKDLSSSEKDLTDITNITRTFRNSIPYGNSPNPSDETASYYEVNASVNTFKLINLKHYTQYAVLVKACREGQGTNCDDGIVARQRTDPKNHADDVVDVTLEKIPTPNNRMSVRVSWHEPSDPNGFIVSYNIRFVRTDIPNGIVQELCITQNMYRSSDRSHIITSLPDVNHRFEVMANSLAPGKHWSKAAHLRN